ncbi:MAG: transcriptional regulator GcvA [Granulosicoccus sp.]
MAGPLPLNALNAFEVAARHRSFSKAAEELNVTPAAISQQIRTLEELLGVRLFHRLSRGLSLTDAGKSGLEKLQDGFRNVNEAVQQIRGEHEHRGLEVWMAPSFAAKWLMPRMHRFVQRHPEIDLRISASPELIDNDSTSPTLSEDIFKTHDIDIAIRFGSGNYPGCHVEKLMPVTALPLCSPALFEDKNRPLLEPADLAQHTLLHDETPYEGRPDWSSWLQAVGATQVDGRRGLHFNRVSLALAAAVESQGVVLTLEQLAADDISKGRLVAPFEHRVTMKQAYHFVSLKDASADERVLAFRNWLFAEVAGNSTTLV